MSIPSKFNRTGKSDEGGIPKKGLYLYHPLTEMLATTPTGQPCTLNGSDWSSEMHLGIPCMRFLNTFIAFGGTWKTANKDWIGAFSLWICRKLEMTTTGACRNFRMGNAALNKYSTGIGVQLYNTDSNRYRKRASLQWIK